MDPVISLAQTSFSVEPGAEARTTIAVRNPGTIVEEYTFAVLGDAADWLSVEPAVLSLFPGENKEVALVARPPRVPAPPAGPTPFAVRCRSTVEAEDSTVVEGEVRVGGYVELALSLSPAIARRRRTGRFRATVTNRGNLADRVRLLGSDPTDELRFTVKPSVVEVPGSGRADAVVTVRPAAMFLKGAPRRQPFELTAGKLLPPRPGDPEGPKASAVLDQRPVLSGAMTFVIGLVVAAVAALAVLAKLNRDASIRSRARDTDPVVAELSQVEPAGVSGMIVFWKTVPGARSYKVEQVAAGGSGGAPQVQQSVEASGDAVSVSVTGLDPETQYCFRLTAVTALGASAASDLVCAKTPAESSFPPPSGLLVTPVADTGSVQVTWTPSAPNAQHILLVDGKPQDPVAGAAAQLQVSPGTHCFSVVGVAPDGSQTKPSNQSCLPVAGPATTTTTAAPGTPTTLPSATTSSTSTTSTTIVVAKGWLAVIEAIPTADYEQTEPLERAQRRRAEFEQAGFSVNLATSDALGLRGEPSWILYEDGLESSEKVNELCASMRSAGLLSTQSCVPFNRTSG